MPRPDLRLNLNLFRVLEAIHAHGGISAAARALHLSQPAVSHALAQLREAFGDPLFVRQGNRMLPTDRARAVIDDVRTHLQGLQATLHRQATFRPETLEGTFTLGFRDVLESIVFPPLIARIERAAPHVHLVSRRIAAHAVERSLGAGRIDLVVDRRLAAGARLSSRHLLDESLVVVMRGGHPLAAGTLDRSDYLAARHVAVSQLGEAVPLDVLLEQDGRAREIRLTCQHYFAACQVAAASDLLLTMPRSYAGSFARLLPITIAPLPFTLKPIPVLAYWHPSREREPAHAWLRAQVIETIASILDRDGAPPA